MVLRWFRRRAASPTDTQAEPEPPRKPRPRPTLPDPMVPETNLTPFFWRKR